MVFCTLEAGGDCGRRSRAQGEGSSRRRLGALRRGAGCWVAVACAPRARLWRRLVRAAVREAAPGMGGREWPQRPLLGIIVTQAISCLEVWEKEKKKIQGGGRGSWAAASQKAASWRGRGVRSCCHLLPRDPEGARCASPGKETQLIANLGCLGGRIGGLALATQRWGRGCGRRGRLVTPASAPTDLPASSLLCKTALSFLPAQGKRNGLYFCLYSCLRSGRLSNPLQGYAHGRGMNYPETQSISPLGNQATRTQPIRCLKPQPSG